MNKQLVCKNLLISYLELGEKDPSPTILFLHGWRSNKEVWGTTMSQLSKVNCQLLAMDLPGFGQSQVSKVPMTVGNYAEVVEEFIKKLDLKNVIIVGHSFGGRVGIKLSSKYPILVSKLVLVDSAGFAMDQDKKIIMNKAAKIIKPLFQPGFMQGLRKMIYKKIGSEDYLATPELQETFVNVVSEDLSEDMVKIKCPTLIINGENDNDTPVRFGELMESLIHNAKFVILPNAGHFSFLDKPAQFTQLLTDFIKA